MGRAPLIQQWSFNPTHAMLQRGDQRLCRYAQSPDGEDWSAKEILRLGQEIAVRPYQCNQQLEYLAATRSSTAYFRCLLVLDPARELLEKLQDYAVDSYQPAASRRMATAIASAAPEAALTLRRSGDLTTRPAGVFWTRLRFRAGQRRCGRAIARHAAQIGAPERPTGGAS